MITYYFDLENRTKEVFLDLISRKKQLPTFQELSIALDIDQEDIQLVFNRETEILESIYAGFVKQYKDMLPAVEGFNECTLEEKLSNFIYVMFGILEKERPFVKATFEQVISQWSSGNHFYRAIEDVLGMFIQMSNHQKENSFTPWEILKNIQNTQTQRNFLEYINIQLLVNTYIELFKFWLYDYSNDFGKTAAYADQMTAFWANVVSTSLSGNAGNRDFRNNDVAEMLAG